MSLVKLLKKHIFGVVRAACLVLCFLNFPGIAIHLAAQQVPTPPSKQERSGHSSTQSRIKWLREQFDAFYPEVVKARIEFESLRSKVDDQQANISVEEMQKRAADMLLGYLKYSQLLARLQWLDDRRSKLESLDRSRCAVIVLENKLKQKEQDLKKLMDSWDQLRRKIKFYLCAINSFEKDLSGILQPSRSIEERIEATAHAKPLLQKGEPKDIGKGEQIKSSRANLEKCQETLASLQREADKVWARMRTVYDDLTDIEISLMEERAEIQHLEKTREEWDRDYRPN